MRKKRSLGTEEYHVCDSCGGEVTMQYGQVASGWNDRNAEHVLCALCVDEVCRKSLKLPPLPQDRCANCDRLLLRTYDGNICGKCVEEQGEVKHYSDYQMVKIYDTM